MKTLQIIVVISALTNANNVNIRNYVLLVYKIIFFIQADAYKVAQHSQLSPMLTLAEYVVQHFNVQLDISHSILPNHV